MAVGYGSSADAEQTNNVSFDQSAVQVAGVGGNGGNGNVASGGNVGSSSSGAGADMIATGGNSAGNGGDGHFFGALVNAPVVIYHPINIAHAAPGGTAEAIQSNTVEIDQSAVQIAGVGGNGGNGNAAVGGDVSTSGIASGSSNGGIGSELIDTGGSQAGNGEDGFSMEASSTHLSRCIARSTFRLGDIISALTPTRQTTCIWINPPFRWPASEETAVTATP